MTNTTQSPDPWPRDVSGRVAVLIPSRNRPQHLFRAIDSVMKTSKNADVLVYIDDDQSDMYRGLIQDERIVIHKGPRIGPAPAANVLVEAYPGYAAYGLITDDTTTVTLAWDEWLLRTLAEYPFAVVSPRHNLGEHVDMPFVSRKWIDVVGWYACPGMIHYSWPILMGLIGEMTCVVHAGDGDFRLIHEGLPHTNQDVRDADAREFFDYVALKLPVPVYALRAAMGESV